MERHDLLLLTEEGQERALEEAGVTRDPFLMDRQREYEMTVGEAWCIPAVFKRQERLREGIWETGFSFPWFRHGHRIRLSGEVREADVVKIFSPFDILKCPMDSLDARWRFFLNSVRETAGELQIAAGIYGSAALTILSGLSYLHEDSDLDMIVRAASATGMASYLSRVQKLAAECKIKVDLEIRVEGEGDIKAQELFSDQRTVVVRGNNGIWISDRRNMENKIDTLANGGYQKGDYYGN